MLKIEFTCDFCNIKSLPYIDKVQDRKVSDLASFCEVYALPDGKHAYDECAERLVISDAGDIEEALEEEELTKEQ